MRSAHALLGFATLALAAVLAACGGGHGAVVPPPAGAGGATVPSTQSVTVTVNIPGQTSASLLRRAQYVGAGTKSMLVTAASVIVPPPPTAAPSPGMTAGPAFQPTPSATADINCTTTTCTTTLTGVPVGTDLFTVNLYDAPVPVPTAAQGQLISTGSATQVITTGTNTVNLTFNGVPVGVQLMALTNPLPNPSPVATVSAQVVMSVQDVDGYTILGPGGFTSPYSFTTSSTHVTLAPNAVATPLASGQTLTLSYDGTLPAATVVSLYSSNAAVNGGAAITAGSLVIGPATPAPTPPAVGAMTPTPVSTPTGLASGTFPIVFQNNGVPGPMTAYVVGLDTATESIPMYLTSRTSGALTAVTSTVAGIALGSGTTAELDVPELCSARVYLALGGTTLSITGSSSGVTQPAPWKNGDPSASAIFDIMEYTWADAGSACPNGMGLDVSAVDDIGIPMALTVIQPGFAPVGPVGLSPHAGSNVALGLGLLGAPWSTLIQSYTPNVQVTTSPAQAPLPPQIRVFNPSHALATGAGTGMNFPANYLAGYMQQLCQTYTTTDLMLGGKTAANVNYLAPSIPGGVAYGRYSGACGTPAQTLTFYTTPFNADGTNSGSLIWTFNGTPSTSDALGNSGYFSPPNLVPMPKATTNPGVSIGRMLAVGINRSTFTLPVAGPSPMPTSQSFLPVVNTVQPVCPANASAAAAAAVFYGASATGGGATITPNFITNWYSALAHQYAYGNSVYGFADDDECSIYAPYVSANGVAPYAAGTMITVTIEPF